MHGYFRTSNWHQTLSVWHSHRDLCNKTGTKQLKLLSWCTLMFLLIESVQQQCSFSLWHGFHLLYSSRLYTVYTIATGSEACMIIVVDTMKRMVEHWVALSSYKLKWLWWIGKMLVEAQGNLTHLLFLSPCSTNAAQSLCNTHFPPSLHIHPCYPSLFSLISSLHKSLCATFSFCALLFFPSPPFYNSWHGRCSSFLSSPDSLCSSPSLHRSCQLCSRRGVSQMRPHQHLLCFYLLILPSVSIKFDCCHFRPVCPCISFLFCLSLSNALFPLSSSFHLSPGEQTCTATLTPPWVGVEMLNRETTPFSDFIFMWQKICPKKNIKIFLCISCQIKLQLEFVCARNYYVLWAGTSLFLKIKNVVVTKVDVVLQDWIFLCSVLMYLLIVNISSLSIHPFS